jgi:hypothetical protein
MELSKENIRAVKGELDAQAVYREVKQLLSGKLK